MNILEKRKIGRRGGEGEGMEKGGVGGGEGFVSCPLPLFLEAAFSNGAVLFALRYSYVCVLPFVSTFQ